MTGYQEALNAANKRPSARTADEQRAVDDASGDVRIRNANHEAERQERIYGTARR